MTLPAVALAAAAISWAPVDQFLTPSITDTSVSSDGVWFMYAKSTGQVSSGELKPASAVVLGKRGNTSFVTSVTSFCSYEGQPCSNPRFCPNENKVIFAGNATAIYSSELTKSGVWSTPTLVTQAEGNIVALQCTSTDVYYSVATAHDPPSEHRVIDTDIIIDVISDAPIPGLMKLCKAPLKKGSSGSCFGGALQDLSVGAVGWFLSCWQYPSTFDVNTAAGVVAMTTTTSLNGDYWEGVRAQLYNISSGELTPLSSSPSFQGIWSVDGKKVAFAEIDNTDYKWAQTWHVCVYDVSTKRKTCAADSTGTPDQMPTLIGWSQKDSVILYLQQLGTSVVVSEIDAATLKSIPNKPFSPHVIGGGFRASMAPVYAAGAPLIALAKESPKTPPQLFVCPVDDISKCVASGAPADSPAASAAPLPSFEWQTVRYDSQDGQSIEAIMVGPNSSSKLLVFTHCGPAMAQLSTYMGFGTVCAGFPLLSLMLQGYQIVMPNYRGSSGYGAAFRRLDANDWGGEDYNDILTAMKVYGTSQGKKVGHFGWSYGGYMSTNVLTRAKTSHGIDIEAIVAGGSLNDLISQVGTTDINGLYPSVYGGKSFWEDPSVAAKMMAHSAIYHVQNATAPTLLLHGAHDPRMPISQAWQLHHALRARRVTNRFVVFPGSGHIPGDLNQRLTILTETLDWFQRHF
eukprot:Hpha_TRINITY_DN9142_c0_g1::TRINITY_DN9142_c0_g1_i1::g.94264::m.94264